jgi:hypothetical protein
MVGFFVLVRTHACNPALPSLLVGRVSAYHRLAPLFVRARFAPPRSGRLGKSAALFGLPTGPRTARTRLGDWFALVSRAAGSCARPAPAPARVLDVRTHQAVAGCHVRTEEDRFGSSMRRAAPGLVRVATATRERVSGVPVWSCCDCDARARARRRPHPTISTVRLVAAFESAGRKAAARRRAGRTGMRHAPRTPPMQKLSALTEAAAGWAMHAVGCQ